jgi:cell wall-associated NlpC family hydrolase
VINLSPNVTTHPAAKYVDMPWSEDFNCWGLIRAVQADVFGRKLPELPIGADENQTAALLAVVVGWSRVSGRPIEGDIVTMTSPTGPHVGVVVQGRLMHNVGHKNPDGTCEGRVRVDDLDSLGSLGFGHLKVWRAKL